MPTTKDLIADIKRVLGSRMKIVRVILDEQGREIGRITTREAPDPKGKP
jgi:hypothetical protein